MKNRKLKYLLLSLLLVCTMTFGIVAYAAGGKASDNKVIVQFMCWDEEGKNLTSIYDVKVEKGAKISTGFDDLKDWPTPSGKIAASEKDPVARKANSWENAYTIGEVTPDSEVPEDYKTPVFIVRAAHKHEMTKELEAAIVGTCQKPAKGPKMGCAIEGCEDYYEDGEDGTIDSDNHEELSRWAYDPDDPTEAAKGHFAICNACKRSVTEAHKYDDPANADKCSVCEYVKTGEEPEPSCKHENLIIAEEEVAPTCTEDGKKATWVCIDCSKMYLDELGNEEVIEDADGIPQNTKIEKLGHNLENVKLSWNETNHYKVCARCSEVVEETKAAHTFNSDNKCTECGYEKVETPVHKHDLQLTNQYSVCKEKKYYHCEKDGCDVEGGLYAKDAEGLSPLDGLDDVRTYTNHDEVKQKWDDTQHWNECEVCKEVDGTKTDHKLFDVTGTAVAASCAKDGKEADQECSDCAYTKTGAPIDKSTVAHKPGTEWKSDKDNHWHECTVCASKLDDSVAKHTPGAEATETTPQTCTTCGYVIVPATGAHKHTMTTIEAKAATCTEDGNEEYYTCSGCDKLFKDEAGTTEINVADITIGKLGHQMKEDESTYKAPTCTEAGKAADKKCSRCDATEAGGKIAATGHKWEEDKWMTDKDNHWHICSVCQEKKDMAAHVPGAEATETEPQRCTVCDYILNPATGEHTHNLSLVEAKEPGHATTGHEAYYACDGCSKIFKDAEGTDEIASLEDIVIPATSEHEFGEWVVTKEPTTTEEGTKERTCSVCGEKEIATIAVLEPVDPEESPKPSEEPQETDAPNTDAPKNDPTKTSAPKPSTNVSPKTGDQSDMVIWMVLMLTGATGVALHFVSKKRNSESR